MLDSLSEDMNAFVAFRKRSLCEECVYLWLLRGGGDPAAVLGLGGGVEAVGVFAGFSLDGDLTDVDRGVHPAAKSGLGCEVWDGRDLVVVLSDRV